MYGLPVLYSFAKDQLCSVASQFAQGASDIQLHPNLSQTATNELLVLHDLIANVALVTDDQDKRTASFHGNKVGMSYFYRLHTFRGVRSAFGQWICDALIPPKHRVFLWLVFWGRLNMKDNMVRKKWTAIAPHAVCDICLATESIDHLLLRCQPASYIWDKLHMSSLANASNDLVHFMGHAADHLVSKRKWHVAFAACAVTLWHARNDRVFNNKRWTASYIKFYAADMLRLWIHRTRRCWET
jgi:hypothetical protein